MVCRDADNTQDRPSGNRGAIVKSGDDGDADWACTRFWAPNCSPEDFTKILELDTSPTKPELLSSPGKCLVYPDWSSRRVVIKAENDGIIDEIICKLDRVHNIYSDGYDVRISHLVHVDDKPKMMFKVVPVNKQPERWTRTIYEYGSQWWVEEPAALSSVRLLVWDAHEKEFVRCKVDYLDIKDRYHNQPREWTEYLFVRKEAHKEPAQNENQLVRLAQLILHEPPIAPEMRITQFHADTTAGSNSSRDINGIETPKTGPSDPRYGRTARVPKPRAGVAGTPGRTPIQSGGIPSRSQTSISDMDLSSSASVAGSTRDVDEEQSQQPMDHYVPGFLLGSRPVQAEEQQEGLTVRKIKQRKGHEASPPSSIAKSITDSEGGHLSTLLGLGSRPVNNEPAQEPGLTTRQPKSRKPAVVSNTADPTSILPLGARPPVQPLNSEEIPGLTTRVPKARKGAAVPTTAENQKTKENAAPQAPASEAETDDSVVTVFTARGSRQPKARRNKKATYSSSSSDKTTGVSVSGIGRSGIKVAAKDDEERTRIFKNTMKQKAPSKMVSRLDKDSEQLRRHNNTKLSNDFMKAFEHVRSFRGQLRFESQIGRLAFADIGKNSIRDPIEPKNWRHFVTNEVNFRTVFTTALTREYTDIEHIRNLRASNHGENLFSSEYVAKYVTYEFHCSVDQKECVLEIDAHTFESDCYGPWEEFATSYIANPLHNWDSCVTLTGRKRINIKDGSSLKTIVETLECTGDKTALLTFENPHTDLIVDKVLVKRVTQYSIEPENICKTVPMDIVITEVQQLKILEKKQPSGVMIYQARGKARDAMKVQNRLWYTISVVPTQMNDTLLENTDLGVGETVKWESENMLGYGQDGKGLNVSILTAATNVILRKIDSVGYLNDNNLTVAEEKRMEALQQAAYPEC